jgi:hypothetical protein
MSRNPSDADLSAPPSLPEPETTEPETSRPSPLFQSPTAPPLRPIPVPDLPPSWASPDEPLSNDPDDDSGSPAPSTARKTGRVKLRELKVLAREAIKTAGGFANNLLTAPGSTERAYGLYVPDDDDEKSISEPLASLASRRVPEGADNPDVADVVRLLFGLLIYGMKQRDKAHQLRYVAPPEDPDAPEDESGDPDEFSE